MQRLEGFSIVFGAELNRSDTDRLHALHRALRDNLILGVTDLYAGYVNPYVEYEAVQTAWITVCEWVRTHLPAALDAQHQARLPVTLPVRYDGETLVDVAARTGMGEREGIRLHTQPDYYVYAVGFLPGFPFLGEVEALRLPRRDTPRLQVPFNAVAIANAQSCVYVLPSPGTALTTIYAPGRDAPFPLSPGDTVRFVEAQEDTPDPLAVCPLWPGVPAHPALRAEKPGRLDLLGRFVQAHHGMARSGPLDECAPALADHIVGNPPITLLLELTLLGPPLTALHEVVLVAVGHGMTRQVAGRAVPAQSPFVLRAGKTLGFTPTGEGARSYLAVAGGLETRPFLGSSSVGPPLMVGDVLGLDRQPVLAAAPTGRAAPDPRRADLEPPARPAGDLPGAWGRCPAPPPIRVREGDRMGIRLEEPDVPGGQVIGEATLHGAVQVTPAGQRIRTLEAASVGITSLPSFTQKTCPGLPSCGPINWFVFDPICLARLRVGRAAGSCLHQV
ncbi:carboxyltransferase domain-containing protein [Deinococcus sp. Arct2-2]|uniref:5-oxoprolinase subunit B/C family protein n=1 Tax=Deinococcus sp. Arct2-2 TaxID=2568653 RepID=UPI00197AB875|nr:carboxyltransferase domain-containing protein [Deinococcus sp. Arct2-2]